jgi:hypothetical protein
VLPLGRVIEVADAGELLVERSVRLRPRLVDGLAPRQARLLDDRLQGLLGLFEHPEGILRLAA